MAYFILNPNETDYTKILKIAADDDAKNNLNIDSANIVVKQFHHGTVQTILL